MLRNNRNRELTFKLFEKEKALPRVSFCMLGFLAWTFTLITLDYAFSGNLKDCLSHRNSRYFTQLSAKYFPETTVLTATVFRWDFSRIRAHRYRYSSKSEVSQKGGLFGKESSLDSFIAEDGFVIIDSRGRGTAKVMLGSVKQTVRVGDETTENNLSEQVLFKHMPENGKIDTELNDPLNASVYAFFIVPETPLRVGESIDMTVEMSFREVGVLHKKNVQIHLKLTKYVRIGTHLCARLDGDVSIPASEAINAKGDKSNFSARGTWVAFFDIEDRRLLSGAVAFLMCNVAETKAPSNELSNTMHMVSSSDTFIQIESEE